MAGTKIEPLLHASLKKLPFKIKGHENTWKTLLFALKAQVSEESWPEQR